MIYGQSLPLCLDLPDMCLTGPAPHLIVGTIVLLYRHLDVMWVAQYFDRYCRQCETTKRSIFYVSNYIVTRLTDTKRSQKFSREVTFAFMPEA